MGWPSALFVDGSRTGQKFTNDSMMFRNNVLAGNLNAVNNSSASAASVRTKIMANGCDTPTSAAGVLNAPFNYTNPNFTTANSSVAASGASFTGARISDAFFTPTTYRGAMGTDDWTKCWCNFNPQNTNYNAGPINNGFAYNAGNDTTICSGRSVVIGQALTGPYKYSWAPANGLSAANVARPTASPASSVTYVVTVTDSVSGCSIVDSVRFTVNPTPVANFTFVNGTNGLVTFTNTSTGATVYNWTFGDGNTSNSSAVTVTNTYAANGVFNVRLTATAGPCSNSTTKPVNVAGIAAPIKSVVGDITSNTTWSKDTIYILNGYVYVKNNATLTIEAGTLIKGDASNKGCLIITRNGRINANGTRNMPIVFTSNKAAGSRQPGDWGGVVILGKARTNRPTDCSTCPGSSVAASEPGIQNAVEGDLDNASGDGLYGGTDDNHNSGVFRYVRLEYGGVVITPGNEINGLTMGGVGKATQMDHIQVTQANDDAFEWFGGNVDAKYLISHRNIDDDLDVDFGYTGKVQFAVVLRDSNWYDIGSGPTTNGWESDNDGSGSEATPYTDPTFSNITVVGPLANGRNLTTSTSFNNGARIRRNSSTSIFNTIIMGWPSGLFVDGTRTGQKFTNDSMMFKNNILAGNLNAVNNSSANASAVRTKIIANGCDTPTTAAGLLGAPFNYTEPDFTPVTNSIALSGASFSGSRISDAFFTNTTFRGAFGANDTWTDCWSNFNPQVTDYSAAPVKYNPAVASFTYTQTLNTLTVQFNNNTIGGRRYLWDFGVSSSTSDTSSAQNPTFTFPVAGTYNVTLTAKAPCGDSTVSLQVMVQPSSSQEILKPNSVKLYPNPTKGFATLAFELAQDEEVAVSLFDISGKEVMTLGKQQMYTGSNELTIDASLLTPGVYFTNISSDKFNKTYRLVIVK
jgi:PKD repeat protein